MFEKNPTDNAKTINIKLILVVIALWDIICTQKYWKRAGNTCLN